MMEVNDLIRSSTILKNTGIYCPFKVSSDQLKKTFVLKVDRNNADKISRNFATFIDYIEPVPEYDFFYTPNDLNSNQWNLTKINADQAWDETTGNNILVALVDDAVQTSHPDLSANIWTNPNEIAGNGIDDDGNGYIDDINGWDAADNDNDPNPPGSASPSYFSHGTHCAGIIAAHTDNGVGISSIGFNTTIIPVKIAANATSMLSGAYAGVDYALASGAKIISMSWGGGGYSITYQNLFNYANSIGVTCIAAAGNSNTSTPMYPASYNHVISVGASDPNDIKASFSNFGSTIDVMAPGTGIYSTVPNSTYGFKSGTSMACPLVSGLAALMLAKSPGLSPADLEACLKSSSDDISSQNPSFNGLIGAGRINAFNALNCVKPINANFTSDVVFQCPGSMIQFTDLSNNIPTSWEWTFPGGSPSSSVLQNPSISYAAAGTYNVQLIVHNSGGSDTIVQANYITIGSPSASISGNANLVSGQTGFVTVTFVGSPPFDFTYSNGTANTVVSGVNTNVYQLPVSPTVNTTYSLVSMTGNSCSGSVQGSGIITVVGLSLCGGSNSTLFNKTFGNTVNHTIKSLIETQDGGAVLVGVAPTGLGSNDYVVIKLDAQYNIEWQKGFGTSGIELPGRAQIMEDANGNFVIAGGYSTTLNSRFPQVLKISSTGSLLWSRTINASGPDHYRVALEDHNGNYICLGTANYPIASSDFLITRFDPNGNILDSKAIGRGGNDHVLDAKVLSNGNIAIAGTNQVSGSNRAGTLLILDNNLNIVSNLSYNPGNSWNQFREIIIKQNGNMVLVQENYTSGLYQIVITEVDALGNVNWSKSYSDSNNKQVSGATLLGNGTVAISFSSQTGSNHQLSVLNIDDFGNVVWAKKLPLISNITDVNNPKNITASADGNILIGGNHQTSGVTKLALLKMNQCGELFCGESDFVFNVSPISLAATALSYSSINYGSIKNQVVNEKTLGYSESVECDTVPIGGPVNTICSVDANFSFSNTCFNDSIFFIETSLNNNGNIVFWNWNFGDGSVAGGSSEVSHLYNGPGPFNVQLIVGTDSSCFDTINQVVYLTNNPSIILNDTSICVYDSLEIHPDLTCFFGELTYSWSPTLGLSDPSVLNPIASPAISTTYTLSVTDTSGAVYTGSIIVTVDQNCCKSYPDFDMPLSVCLGDSVIINNTSQPHGVAIYSWDFGVNASPQTFIGSNPPAAVYSNTGAHDILLVLSDDCGVDSISKPLFIEDLPLVEIREDTTVCDTTVLNMGGVSVGNLGYSWEPSISVSDATISNPTALINQSSTFYLEVTDLFTGCKNNDSVQIEFIERSIGFDISDKICLGDSLEVFNTSNSLAAANFEWSFGLGSSPMTSNQENPTNIGYAFSGSKEILLIISDQCGIDSLIQLLTVNDLPNVSIIEDTLICSLTTINIGGADNPNNNYTWEPSVLMANSTTSNPSVSIDSSEVFSVVVANTVTGCVNIDSVLISIQEELPNINLTDTIICQGESTLIVLDQIPGTNYYWEPNGYTGSSISISEEGVYKVTVSNMCSSNSDSLILKTENCNCIFTIPNVFTPNKDDINDRFSIIKSEYCTLAKMQIYNRWGQLMHDDKNKVYSWDGTVLTGDDAPEGTYFYLITVDNISYSGHFLLVR